MWVAVGKVSLDDCDMLTSSLGCTLTGGVAVAAMLAITSLVFILELVPAPGWRTSMGNCSPARWVWARHKAFAGTRTSPMVSCSMRYSVSFAALSEPLSAISVCSLLVVIFGMAV